jgi:raffinose/stachyose/melibiose transport system permease protein
MYVPRAIGLALLWAFVALSLFPFALAILLSVKTPFETAISLLGLPKAITLDNYLKAFTRMSFVRSFSNSLIVTLASVALIVISSAMGGYVISRNLFRPLYRFWEKVFLVSIMVPFQVLMVPAYQMLLKLRLLNTLPGAILFIVGLAVPFATFMYVGYVKTVPLELEESASIEGAGPFRTFWRIVFPLLQPVTASLCALEAMWVWNEFNVSIIVLQRETVRTIPMQQYQFFGQYQTNYNIAFAAAVLSLIPILIFFAAAQKFIIGGITAGAVKG